MTISKNGGLNLLDDDFYPTTEIRVKLGNQPPYKKGGLVELPGAIHLLPCHQHTKLPAVAENPSPTPLTGPNLPQTRRRMRPS